MRISLKAARISAGMTQKQVAKYLNKNTTTISNWENGKTKIDSTSFFNLCCLYKCSTENIFLPCKFP